MTRSLYLVAYDVAEPRRLTRVGRYFGSYRVAGQKSVPEIWITAAELYRIRTDMQHLLDPATDRLQIMALDPRMTVRCLGRANTFEVKHFCIT